MDAAVHAPQRSDGDHRVTRAAAFSSGRILLLQNSYPAATLEKQRLLGIKMPVCTIERRIAAESCATCRIGIRQSVLSIQWQRRDYSRGVTVRVFALEGHALS
ncbi:MAG: hypothetical protein NTV22_00310 [bacterium]|nr:hypothetical protein [bacterium]